nr:MAG TPA: hypothetical protein [Caudoviricetes sp.]
MCFICVCQKIARPNNDKILHCCNRVATKINLSVFSSIFRGFQM